MMTTRVPNIQGWIELGQPKYLRPEDLSWYSDRLDRCGFCNWVYHRTAEGSLENWTIWVTNAENESRVTGLPDAFDVYVQAKSRKAGHKAHWDACYDHAYRAYLDYQQIMLDELHDWEMTDRWMQRRSGRI